MSINQIIDVFISGSITSQLTKKSLVASNPLLLIQAYENEKQEPVQ